ncbi:hypothetical protein Forpe1208_v000301 [Fusarium oxysporum f. sp. rapae]|uniref:BTB domain-containing protein n=1 Tax=Fusarium oxysporum f. sp. rapae TaxID=485398 RepID=A0A8J5U107_FUSOX|nr:hypothetical protein Forpe1208_v000301 [Fusarium oxysporum f. sp. rapae]
MTSSMKSISYDIDPRGDIVPESLTHPADPQDPEFPNPPCLGRYEVFSELYPDDQNKTPEVEVRMRVSSRHLILASRTFRAMLEGPWKEGNSSFRPIRQISAKDWDAFALAIVLDSIYGRHHGIPTKITDGLLTRIATIVDYYECREAMHFNYEVWTHGKTPPSELCNAALLWLMGASHFETHELPVGGVLNLLDGIRRTLINRVLEAIGSLHETLINEEGCKLARDPDCTAIMLGMLVREMRNIACLDPPLDASFDGHSLHEMLLMVSIFRIPMLPHNDLDQPNEMDEDGNDHPCTIQGRLASVLQKIEEAIQGVSLADFQS